MISFMFQFLTQSFHGMREGCDHKILKGEETVPYLHKLCSKIVLPLLSHGTAFQYRHYYSALDNPQYHANQTYHKYRKTVLLSNSVCSETLYRPYKEYEENWSINIPLKTRAQMGGTFSQDTPPS